MKTGDLHHLLKWDQGHPLQVAIHILSILNLLAALLLPPQYVSTKIRKIIRNEQIIYMYKKTTNKERVKKNKTCLMP